MASYTVLTDADVDKHLPMAEAISVIEDALREKAEGTLIAPPRFRVELGKGALVFTVGAATGREGALGFRVYETFGIDSPDHAQLVAVFDSENGAFKGLIIGKRLGDLRTGAIGGVAIKHLARRDARVLGLIGSGAQARTQLEAAVAVRELETIRVYSRTPAHREAFAREMGEELHLNIQVADSAEEAAAGADVVICATTSSIPVLRSAWLKEGVHVNTLGPKFHDAHEIEIEIAERAAVIATDSLAQVDAYPKPFFLADTPYYDRMVELADLLAGKRPGRSADDQITLFLSVGLAGTEVVVANELLRRVKGG